jgi:putative endonuclease
VAFFTYIITSQRNGTLDTGSTDSMIGRTSQHQLEVFRGFSARYGCKRLVWYEMHETRHAAFVRERRIKKWNRIWKLDLIERINPSWRDLSDEWLLPPDLDSLSERWARDGDNAAAPSTQSTGSPRTRG